MSDDPTTSDDFPMDEMIDTGDTAGTENAEAVRAEENAALKDQLLRLAAEIENLRKRSAREIADTRAYAIAGFARDMLVATDNLSRALANVDPEAREGDDAAFKALIDGIEMTEREMYRLLEKNGVKPIDAHGKKFDPHLHEAVFEVPDANVAPGTVVQVMQAGFAIGDRVLRPAMVGVAKGGGVQGGGAQGGETNAAVDDDGPAPRIDKEV